MAGLSIAYALYHMVPRISLGKSTGEPRQGALLRITFSKELVGYCDCHPWPLLGDLPLDPQLEYLQGGRLTPLLQRSMEFARYDAEARQQGIHLLDGLTIPQSHYLVDRLASYDCIKVKVDGAKSLPRWLLQNPSQKIRLDFNGTLPRDHLTEWRPFLEKLNLDFIEDPFSNWSEEYLKAFPLAWDRGSENGIGQPVGTLIVKPAIQDPTLFTKVQGQRVIFTSYAAHPFEQVCAAWEAARFYKKCPQLQDRCGLLSHLIYESNAFSEQLGVHDDRLEVSPGTGFGFDQLLKNMEWKSLS